MFVEPSAFLFGELVATLWVGPSLAVRAQKDTRPVPPLGPSSCFEHRPAERRVLATHSTGLNRHHRTSLAPS
jgi:hypothetical protein